MTNPADDHTDAYFDAMQAESAKRLGILIGAASKAVMNEAGFDWRPAATQAAIAARFRALTPDTDLTGAITQVIVDTYTEHGFPHDRAAVRQSVTRHLDGGTDG